MLARLCAVALITLCVLPFTQPFATDAPDLDSAPSANPAVSAVQITLNLYAEPDGVGRRELQPHVFVAAAPVAALTVAPVFTAPRQRRPLALANSRPPLSAILRV